LNAEVNVEAAAMREDRYRWTVLVTVAKAEAARSTKAVAKRAWAFFEVLIGVSWGSDYFVIMSRSTARDEEGWRRGGSVVHGRLDVIESGG
jgi:hypothetical protein